MLVNILNSDGLRAFAYLVAAAGSALFVLRQPAEGSRDVRVTVFWGGIAALMLLLAIGRYWDLGPWVTDRGRDLAYRQGWYLRRRPIQERAVRMIIACGVVGSAMGLLWFVRAVSKEHPLAFTATVILVTFVLVRAISFHPIDQLLYRDEVAHLRPNAVIELGATAFMNAAVIAGLIASGRAGRNLSRQHAHAPPLAQR